MIRNKKKFIDSYNRYISSKDFISSKQSFLYTTNLTWNKFDSCIDIKNPKLKNIYFVGDALFTFPPSFAQGASQSIESSSEVYEEIINNTNTYYKKRLIRIKSVNYRSKLNLFSFHLSNPVTVYLRNIFLKYLTKKNSFLENYLGKIYKG